MSICRVACASAVTFSAQTGSSNQNGLILLHRSREPHRVHRRQAAVNLDQHVDPVADRLAHHAHPLDRQLLLLARDPAAPATRHRVELQRREPALDDRLRARRQLLQRVHPRPAVGVDSQPIAQRPAEQLVHRHARPLAGQVPERLLDPTDRAVEVHRPAAIAEVVVDRVGERLDLARVPADHVALQLVQMRPNLHIAVRLRVALAPAVQAVLRLEPHEDQVLARDVTVRLPRVRRGRVNDVVAQVNDVHGNFHSTSAVWAAARAA